MARRRATRTPSHCAIVLVVAVALAGCGAHHRATPEQLGVWSREHFSSCLLQEINDGKVRFEGGDGSSFGSAIVIVGASGEADGVPAEYFYISTRHGVGGRDWQPVMQALHERDGRHFDILTVSVTGEWTNREYYFDISEFIGKDSTCFGYIRQNAGR